MVASIPIPEVIRNIDSFTLGAQSMNPKVKTKVVWVNKWFDPPKESEAAQALMNDGADVLMQNTDSSAVLQTAEKAGKLAFGWDSDMSKFGPNAHLGSAVINWAPYYKKAVKDALDGTWKIEQTWWGVKDGAIDLVSVSPTRCPARREEEGRRGQGRAEGRARSRSGRARSATRSGKKVLKAGKTADDGFLLGINFYVKGVEGKLPHKRNDAMIDGDALRPSRTRACASESRAARLPAPPLDRAARGATTARRSTTWSSSAPGRAAWPRRSGSRASAIDNLLVVDENPLDRAGPWLNFARMRTLRTPKYLTGPDLGIPSLTPRAWYEAQHGAGSWEALGLIPKETWADYLRWYRQTLEHPGAARHARRRAALERGASARGRCRAAGARAATTRRCSRAAWCWPPASTARAQWQMPAHGPRRACRARSTRTRAGHRLRGARAASASPCSAPAPRPSTTPRPRSSTARARCTCSSGAQSWCNVNAYRWAEFVGLPRHLGDLPDADKWRFIRQILRMGQLPPADTLGARASTPGFHLHAGLRLDARSRRAATASRSRTERRRRSRSTS